MLCTLPAHTFLTLSYKKVLKCSKIEILNLGMCLVDLVKETLEFMEALLYQLLTPTTRLPNLSQRATQFMVCLNYKYSFLL